MERRLFIKGGIVGSLYTLIAPKSFAEQFLDESTFTLPDAFLNPPSSTRPQVFWFWMNGNVTKKGIALDLEAMKQAGVGGVFNFEVGTGIPKGPIEYLSKDWLELKKHAIREAERLDLEFTMHNCPGWSSSGGPWITPELAMQQFTWSELYVSGGKQISLQLPKPFNKLNYYRDVAVLAFPSLEGEAFLQNLKISSNDATDFKHQLEQYSQGIIVQSANDSKPGWVQFEFDEPFKARSITFLISSFNKKINNSEDLARRTSVMLQSSNDGHQFNDVTSISTGTEFELQLGDKFITYDITPTEAKYFRIVCTESRRISQVRFSAITRLKNFMEKGNYRFMFTGDGMSNIFTNEYQNIPQSSIIKLDSVLDISQYLDRDGKLNWSAPPGNWTIMRIGFTPVGTFNHAAPDTGVGLECDKYSKTAFDFHFAKMMEKLLPFIKLLAEKGKAGLEIDSYEAGMQNWTQEMPEEFYERRGYNLIKYLPILTGRIVRNIDITERFLWDFRKTQADLIGENYYGRFHDLCHQNGITSYIQPYDKGPMEEMQIGSKVDVNLGEYWYGLSSILQGNLRIYRTPKLAASIAHTNNQKIVGAEVFTSEPASSKWQEYPFAMKPLADKVFIKGVNKIIIHRFAHQPHPTALPGMTMGPWGIQYDRTNTWWKQGREFAKYLTRCQYMLRQGLFVADLLYFTGEEANIYTRVNRDEINPSPPDGYDYDLGNADTVLKRMKVVNNRIVLLDGMEYSILILQDYKAISLKLLRRLYSLVEQGMMLIGAPPERSLGLNEYDPDDREFKEITNKLWNNIDGSTVTENKFGKGRIFWGEPLQSILQKLDIKPDFEFSSRSGDAPILYIHRKTVDTHLYFISNQRRSYEELVCTFRVSNKQPELWDAITGKITKVTTYELIDDRVRLPVQLEPYGSIFIVFRLLVKNHHLLSVMKDNERVLSTKPFAALPRKLFKDVADNFTIAFWIKPEMDVMLTGSIHMESINNAWTDYYAIFPPSGKTLYGEGHATTGLAVGRNGVAVWEHEDNNPLLVMTAPTPISGWTHIALIYKEGVPSIYVNGNFLQEGKYSGKIIHPGLGEAYLNEGASYYNGDMSEPQLFKEVLSRDKIIELANEMVPELASSPVVIESHADNNPNLLIWQNGHYTLQNNLKQTSAFHISNIDEPLNIKGPWQVNFPPNLGAPSEITLSKLTSLHKHHEDGVKYFSGTATYISSITISANDLKNDKLFFLDLGRVEVIAEVLINEKYLGTLWKRPYKINITNAIKPGLNHLAIKVTNLWPNRLIGDEQLPNPDNFSNAADSISFESSLGGAIQQLPDWYLHQKPRPLNGRITFTTWRHYTKESPLLESGLIGPVILHTAVIRRI